MKVLIEIPDTLYERYKELGATGQILTVTENAICNGQPLPIGHDDLISRQAVLDLFPIPPREKWTKKDCRFDWIRISREMISELPPILPNSESSNDYESVPMLFRDRIRLIQAYEEWRQSTKDEHGYIVMNCALSFCNFLVSNGYLDVDTVIKGLNKAQKTEETKHETTDSD